jgi:hypothetical protein
VAERANTIQFAHEQDAKVAREQHVQWANEQDDLFIKSHPEFADPVEGPRLQQAVARFVKDTTGLSDTEIAGEWNRPNSPWRSYHGQAILAAGAKNAAYLENIKASAAKPLPKNLPPVLRPGVSHPRPASASNHSRIQAIQRQMQTATSNKAIRLAAELTRLQREVN